MDTVSVNRFRDNLKTYVEQAINEHEPVKVTRRSGPAFVVMSAEDWEREQETLHVLQSADLMRQLAESTQTHAQGRGRTPTDEELHEITDL
ncbi:MAG: type II toxin-antitoxin system Phd/YefM family antitoxin [Thiohalospira sp.]